MAANSNHNLDGRGVPGLVTFRGGERVNNNAWASRNIHELVNDFRRGRLSVEEFFQVCRTRGGGGGGGKHLLLSNCHVVDNGSRRRTINVFHACLERVPEDDLVELLEAVVNERRRPDDVRTTLSVSPRGIDGGSGDGGTLLHIALAHSNYYYRDVQLLLAVPGCTRLLDANSRTPLLAACERYQHTHPDVIHRLLDLDPSALTKADRHTNLPLHHVLAHDPSGVIVQRMIELRPYTILYRDNRSRTPVIMALEPDKVETWSSPQGAAALCRLIEQDKRCVIPTGMGLVISTPLMVVCANARANHDVKPLIQAVLNAHPPSLVIPDVVATIAAAAAAVAGPAAGAGAGAAAAAAAGAGAGAGPAGAAGAGAGADAMGAQPMNLPDAVAALLRILDVMEANVDANANVNPNRLPNPVPPAQPRTAPPPWFPFEAMADPRLRNGRKFIKWVRDQTMHMALAVIEYVLNISVTNNVYAFATTTFGSRRVDAGTFKVVANVAWFQRHLKDVVQEHFPNVPLDDDKSGLSVARDVYNQWRSRDDGNGSFTVAVVRALFGHTRAVQLLHDKAIWLRNIVLSETVVDLYRMNRHGRFFDNDHHHRPIDVPVQHQRSAGGIEAVVEEEDTSVEAALHQIELLSLGSTVEATYLQFREVSHRVLLVHGDERRRRPGRTTSAVVANDEEGPGTDPASP